MKLLVLVRTESYFFLVICDFQFWFVSRRCSYLTHCWVTGQLLGFPMLLLMRSCFWDVPFHINHGSREVKMCQVHIAPWYFGFSRYFDHDEDLNSRNWLGHSRVLEKNNEGGFFWSDRTNLSYYNTNPWMLKVNEWPKFMSANFRSKRPLSLLSHIFYIPWVL